MESKKKCIIIYNSQKIDAKKIAGFQNTLGKTDVSTYLDIKYVGTENMEEITPFENPEEVEVLGIFWAGPKECEAVLRAHSNIKWINSFTAGVDALMTDYIKSHPAQITNSKGVFSNGLAEFVAFQMLYFSKNSHKWMQDQKDHKWDP